MTKKAQILVSLVKETNEMPNDELAKEIHGALQKVPQVIPWIDKVLMVNVTDD